MARYHQELSSFPLAAEPLVPSITFYGFKLNATVAALQSAIEEIEYRKYQCYSPLVPLQFAQHLSFVTHIYFNSGCFLNQRQRWLESVTEVQISCLMVLLVAGNH